MRQPRRDDVISSTHKRDYRASVQNRVDKVPAEKKETEIFLSVNSRGLPINWICLQKKNVCVLCDNPIWIAKNNGPVIKLVAIFIRYLRSLFDMLSTKIIFMWIFKLLYSRCSFLHQLLYSLVCKITFAIHTHLHSRFRQMFDKPLLMQTLASFFFFFLR